MTDISNRDHGSLFRGVPREAINIIGTALAIFVTVAAGASIAQLLPADPSPWLFAGSYAAPGAAVFAIYWYIAQKL